MIIPASKLRERKGDFVAAMLAKIEKQIIKAADGGSISTNIELDDGFDYSKIVEELKNAGYQAKLFHRAGDWRELPAIYIQVRW